MQPVYQSDEELWRAITNDNEPAFATLFERYWELLYNNAYLRLRNHEECEEIVHDVFLSIWERRKTVEIQSCKAYLLTAVRYQIYNRLRLAKHLKVHLQIDDQSDFVLAHNEGENRLMVQEFHSALSSKLKALPKRCREIFHMSRMNQLSNEEIANELGISRRSVENQITSALKHLRGFYRLLIYISLFYELWHHK